MMEKRFADSSKEDYLKAILVIINEKEKCRVIDIARYLDVTKASASIAVKKLEDGELVIRENSSLLLTEKGKTIAEQVYEKGSFLEEWLIKIGVDEGTAKEDACAIEHVLSEKSYKKMKAYMNSDA